jgi:hypothetical protein
MNLNKFWGIVGATLLSDICTIAIGTAAVFLLPTSVLDLIFVNEFISILFYTGIFFLPFSLFVYAFRKGVINKNIVARNFVILFLVFYLPNIFLQHTLTAVLLAFVFPIGAFFVSKAILTSST